MNCLVKWPPMANQACGVGNGTVRSPGDNVAMSFHPRRRHELARRPMRKSMNACNPRYTELAKSWTIRPAKRQVASRWCYTLAILPFSKQPGEGASLKALINVIGKEHGKPVTPQQDWCAGTPTARKGEGAAGKGRRRKQMSRCNAEDRDPGLNKLDTHLKRGPLPAGSTERENLGTPRALVRLSDGASH